MYTNRRLSAIWLLPTCGTWTRLSSERDRTCTRSSLYGSSRSGSKRCEGACAIGETVPWLVSSRFIARHAKAWKLKKNYDVLQLEPRRFSWEIHLLLLWELVACLLMRGWKPRRETEFCCCHCWEETKNWDFLITLQKKNVLGLLRLQRWEMADKIAHFAHIMDTKLDSWWSDESHMRILGMHLGDFVLKWCFTTN